MKQGGLLVVSEFHILAYKKVKEKNNNLSLITYFLLSKSLVMTTLMLEKSKNIFHYFNLFKFFEEGDNLCIVMIW